MYQAFNPVRIQDVHKSEGEVTVATDADGEHVVKLHSERYSPGVSLWLEPDAARALSAALLEAADEADTRKGEDADLDARCEQIKAERAAEQLAHFLKAAQDRGATVTWITGPPATTESR